ncbi:MAG: 3-hydroxybenzoate 6-monooxygenase [Pseudomonadota bacterium]
MPAATKDLPILIAGGGIGGFAAALALARKGRAVHVIEQSTELGEVGAGIQLGPNVFRMFDALGLTDAINETVCYPDALIMMDALTGDEVTRVPLNTDEFRARFGLPYAVIYRPDLHRAFVDACEKEPLVSVTLGTKLRSYIDHGDHVEARTSAETALKGAALIGSDGLWSSVRQELIGDGAPTVSGHIAYRAVLKTEEVPDTSRNNSVVLWAGPKTHLVHYPLHRGDIYNLVAVFHSDRYEEGWDVFGDTDELKLKFQNQHPAVHAMLDKIESWRMWVLCDREPIRNWSKGRVTLLGDAAHPMLQYLAQGACMATEDAVCLAGKVAEHGDDLEAAFQAYQAARYLRTGRVQLTARLYGDIYHAQGVTAELRAMMLSNRTPEQAYQGMSWLYDGVSADGSQIL